LNFNPLLGSVPRIIIQQTERRKKKSVKKDHFSQEKIREKLSVQNITISILDVDAVTAKKLT